MLPRGDTAQRWPPVNRSVGFHQTPDLLVPWSWTSQPQNYRTQVFACQATQPMESVIVTQTDEDTWGRKKPQQVRIKEMENLVKWPMWVGIADIYEKNKN